MKLLNIEMIMTGKMTSMTHEHLKILWYSYTDNYCINSPS